MKHDEATVPPAPLGQVQRGVRPHAEMLARRLQAAAYNHGLEDGSSANAWTRQAKADAYSRQTLADLLIAIGALANEAANARAAIYSAEQAQIEAPLRAEMAKLQFEVRQALPAMREYVARNPRHHYGETLQDPNGVHAWVARNDRPNAKLT